MILKFVLVGVFWILKRVLRIFSIVVEDIIGSIIFGFVNILVIEILGDFKICVKVVFLELIDYLVI